MAEKNLNEFINDGTRINMNMGKESAGFDIGVVQLGVIGQCGIEE